MHRASVRAGYLPAGREVPGGRGRRAGRGRGLRSRRSSPDRGPDRGVDRRRRAERGERLAARALESAGLEILDRNWRSGRYEIDLVARDGDVVAFVEVKARGPGPQDPLDAVSVAQQRRIRRAAEAWIHAHPGVGGEFRFDAVSVRFGQGPPRVTHVPEAWFGDR